jgi:hypothetical protein
MRVKSGGTGLTKAEAAPDLFSFPQASPEDASIRPAAASDNQVWRRHP